MASNTYYNIYYSTSPVGPWTLSNSSPIPHSDVNTHTVTGLKINVPYYFIIVGGEIVDDEFVPLISQHVSPNGAEALGVGAAKIPAIGAQTFAPKVPADGTLGHQFEINGIV